MLRIAAVLLLIGLPLRRAYAEADAVISAVQGPVRVRPYGEKKFIPAQAGFPLAFKDQVKTGPKGLVHIAFPNDTVLLVKENADFILEGTPRKTWISFAVGEFLIGIKRSLSGGESFQVKTPSAVAAVRGTLFWGFTDSQKNSIWAGFGHKVAITAQKTTVILEPGQTVKVAFGQPPEAVAPSTVPKSFLSTFSIKDGIHGLEKLADPSLK